MRRLMLALVSIAACSCGCDGREQTPPVVGETIRIASGIELTHLVVGAGPRPKASDRVQVHYHGTFPDGTVFESTVEQNEPSTLLLDGAIECWSEGVQRMQVGGKARLVCPPQTAFGERGMPPRIPPNATLQFEVQLLAIAGG